MHYKYDVARGESINMWQTNGMKAKPFESPVASFDHEDCYRKIAEEAIDMRAIAQIIYPVREAFLKNDYITEAPYIEGEFNELYFPWANRKVDFSTFSHAPKILSNYMRCYVKSDAKKTIKLEIKTCGGVKIWINGEVELLYKSYERNVPNSKIFTLELIEGVNELLLYANDLAERDVFFYYELINRSDDNLEVFVPLAQDQKKIDRAKHVMESIHFEKDTYIGEAVTLRYDHTRLEEDMEILCGDDERVVYLSKETNEVVIGDAGNVEDRNFGKTASNYFPVSTIVDGLKIQTVLYLATYNKKLVEIKGKETIEGRKKQAIRVIVEQANKGEIGTALALLVNEGMCSNLCKEIIEIHLERIENRLDCADFRLPVLLLMVKNYGDILPGDIKVRIKRATLNFRYWANEPGNDVMWFFSENHSLLFYVSQYLSGDIYPNEVFANTGRDSGTQKALGYDKIVDWFESFLPRGFEEWNSLTYLPVDCIAFFTLYEAAPDQEIRAYAKKGLDLIFEIIASNVHHHVFASSYGRTYEHTLKGLELGELSMYAWIAWHQGTVNVKNHAMSLFAVSQYEPKDYDDLRNLSRGQAITIERVQGRHKVYTYIHKRKEYALASAMKFHPFETGLQQHFINLSFSEKEIPIWFNHPGERVYSGHNRPSYWGGWQTIPYVEQYKNVIMACIKMKDFDEVDYIHGNIPLKSLDEFECSDQWFIFKKGEAYGAFWFLNGYELTSYGANKDKEIISKGIENAMIIKCGSKTEYDSYEAFVKAIKSSHVDYSSEKSFNYTDSEYGVLKVNIQSGMMKNGELVLRKADSNGLVEQHLKKSKVI